MKYAFGGNTGLTYEQIQRQREIARAMMQKGGTPKTIGEGINSAAGSIAGALMARKADKADAANREEFGGKWDGVVGALMGQTPSTGGLSRNDAMAVYGGPTNAAASAMNGSGDWASVRQGIFDGESGGDYNALFGYSNRPGGEFANVNLTDMSVDQALSFADPGGEYGQWVKGKVGRVSTPMGAYQVVGTTLKAAKDGLGLTGDEKMTPELQEKIGQWIYQTQGTGAWEGYRGPSSGGQGQGQGAAPSMAQAMQLAELASSPYATPGQKAVAQAMMQRATQANDPLRQLQIQQAQLKLQQMQNPQTDPKDRYRVVDGQLVDLTAQGGPTAIDLGGGGGGKDMTESERRIFMFNSMQQQTAPAINMIEDRGFDPSNIQDKLAGGVLAGNFFRSEEGQMYDAAAGAWAESALRLATGAAATPEEYQRIRNMYFAASGDSPETIGFKRSMRESYQNVLRATLEGDMGAEPPTPLTYAIESYYAKQDPAPAPGPAAQPQSEPVSAPQDAGQQSSGLSPEILDALSIAESIGSTEGPSDEQIINAYRAGLNRRDRRRFDAMTPGQQAEEALR